MSPAHGRLLPGRIQLRVLRNEPRQRYYLYVPTGARSGSGAALVAVHGISRNAREQAVQLAPAAERLGVPLIAPLFDADDGRGYQRLRLRDGARADLRLDAVLDDAGEALGARCESLLLWGYSGGAQFAHRYALLHAQRVAAVVLGAAGWYTYPDESVAFPLGVGPAPGLPGLQPDLDRFLACPTLVVVGSRDVAADPALRSSPDIVARQGSHRLERARRWVRAINAAAIERSLAAPARLETLPGVAHDFVAAVEAGLVALLVRWYSMRRADARPSQPFIPEGNAHVA